MSVMRYCVYILDCANRDGLKCLYPRNVSREIIQVALVAAGQSYRDILSTASLERFW